MKKSLIALAVAGAFAAPSAFAEVTISGAINIGIALINSDDEDSSSILGTGQPGQSRSSLATNYSNMNVSSVDDIGNGNKVILNIQFDLGSLSNTSSVNNRNSYLGVEGSWGSFKMGTNENVYERWMYESDPLDGAMGIGGNIQMLGQTGLSGSDWFETGNGQSGDSGSFWRRTHQTVWYTSPNWNGFTFEVDQTLTAFKTDAQNPTVTSIGGQWKPQDMPFFLNLAWEKHTDSNVVLPGIGAAGIFDATGLQFGGGFTFQQWTIYARYEMLEWEDNATGDKLERDHWWLAAKWMMPTGYLGAEFGQAMKAKFAGSDIENSEAMMFSVGYYHNLSKQSQAYLVGTVIRNEENASYGIGAGTGSTGGFGSSHTAATIGLKHVF